MSSSKGKFVIAKDPKGGFRWKLVMRGQAVAVSAKSYKTAANARQAAAAVARNAGTAALPE